jgi:restriction system protein
MYRAGLLERPKRGVYMITDLGRKIAEQNPSYIGREFLMQFPEFAKWMDATEAKSQSAPQHDASVKSDATPK